VPATDDATDYLKAAIDLLWTPQAAPRRGPRPGLSLAAIAKAGIEIADADGLAAVTMQRVAETLGVTKMALYRYVQRKTELVALMTDTGIGAPAPLDPAHDWRTKLDTWAQAIFDRFSRHPWAQETATGVRAIGPNEIAWLEQALAALEGTGLDGSEKLDVAATLSGHARAIAQQAGAAVSASPEHGMESALAMLLPGREDQFPALLAALESAATDGGQDQALGFGLARILDGVELLINSREAASRSMSGPSGRSTSTGGTSSAS
jgi:AcrR family transcriptional regulator